MEKKDFWTGSKGRRRKRPAVFAAAACVLPAALVLLSAFSFYTKRPQPENRQADSIQTEAAQTYPAMSEGVQVYPAASENVQTDTLRPENLPFGTVQSASGNASAGDSSGEAAALPAGELHARAAVLMDADNGRVLWEKEGYTPLPMASTTKIMTCILALEEGKTEDLVTVSAKAAGQPKVKLGMRQGEQYRLEDLLYSLMLESHNDTAMAIAEHIGGSMEGFADKMNEKAVRLGCTDTYFVTPNGLDAERDGRKHSTTARDLALIASYAVKNQDFCKIVGTAAYSFDDASGKRSVTVYNKDRFLTMMDGAFGVKTGFTGGAGYCFVGALKREDRTFISVVLGSGWPPNKTWKWTDTRRIMEYGLEQYEKQNIYRKLELPSLEVEKGREPSMPLTVEEKELTLLLSPSDEVEVKCELPQSLRAPVEKGREVGAEKYYVNGQLYASLPVHTGKEILEFTYAYCLEQVMDRFLP